VNSGPLLFFKPKPNPKDAEKIGRALRELWRRLGPKNDEPKPFPPPLPNPAPPKPKPDKPKDPRTDECVGNCEDKKRCPEKTFCFNKEKYAGTHKEPVYDAQLKVQEATMRTMTPQQVLGNRATYEALGRSALERLPDVQRSKAAVIGQWEFSHPGEDWRSFGYDALHRLDMGARGDPTGYYGMGDASINRSIGGGWPSKTEQLKQHARNLQANGCPLMKVKFDSSPWCVADKIPSSGYPEK
jgi:Novel toxin 15